jgi:hypothetical protein
MEHIKTLDLLKQVENETGYDMQVIVDITKAWEKLKADEPKQAAESIVIQPDLKQTNYYLFNKQEIWSLIAAGTLQTAACTYSERYNMNYADVQKQGAPTQISASRAYAMYKEAITRVNPGLTINELTSQFNEYTTGVVLGANWKCLENFGKDMD